MQQLLAMTDSFPGGVLDAVLKAASRGRSRFPGSRWRYGLGWLASVVAIALLMSSQAISSAQQGSNAGLTGTVTDKSGAMIGGAQVVATNLDTGVAYRATATGVGAYSVPSVPPGRYDVSATQKGFNTAIVKGVTCHVGELLAVNLNLDAATASSTITVSGDEQLMDTASTQINYIIGTKELEGWPVSATGTSPGGERDISQYIYNSLPGSTGISFTGSINGGQTRANEIYFEGLPLGSFDTGEEGASVDAVGEMSVQIGVMNAQYNGGGTAVTNVSLKSGTNNFHGSLVSILQNEDLNANSYAGIQAGKPRSEDRFNLFSGSIGGPVRIPRLYNGRDKSFFFFNYERDQVENIGLGGPNVSMPTQAMMQGDFSAWLNPALTQNAQSGTVVANDILGRPVVFGQIYNPATTRILTAGEVDPTTGLTAASAGLVRDPFLHNQIATSLFDPVAANILKLKFPTNYLSSQVVNNIPTLASTQPTLVQHFATIKGDQVLTSKQKLSLLYDYDFRNLINTGGNPAPLGFWSVPSTAKNVLDQAFGQVFHEQLARINHYWTLSPTVSNHIGAGYFFVPIHFQSVQSPQNWASALGISNFNADGFPQIVFGGQAALGGASNTLGTAGTYQGELRSNSDYMLIDQVYMSRGAHQLQFGFEGRFYLTNWTYPTAPGAYTFRSAMTDDGDSTINYAGNAFASFELGQLASLSSIIYDGTQHYRRHEEGLYFQDDWKVTPRLTLNLGIRWEPVGALYETKGEWSGVDLSIPNPAAGNLPGALVFAGELNKNTFEDPDWKVILPRVGVAYNANPHMVFHAGFGINSQAPVYSAEPFQGSTLPPTTGYTASVAVNSTTNTQAYSSIAVGKLSNPYPAPTAALPNFNPSQSNLQSVNVNNPKGSKPILFANYTAGFQVDLGHGVIGQINYVGNAGRRIRQSALTQLNQLPVSDLSTYGDALEDNVSLHPNIPLPYAGFKGNVNQALAPIPQYAGGGVTLFDAGEGWSRYDALQATISKSMTKDLSFFIDYTWSKTLTDTNGGVQNIANLKAEKAVASFLDVPQLFKFTVMYSLPFGKDEMVNLHGPLDWAFGGWKLAANGIYQSGDTLGITDSFVSNGIFATTRPNYTGQPVELNRKGFIDTVHNTGPLYLNPAAFTHVPYTPVHKIALTTGSVPPILPGIFGPGYAFENLGLQKAFSLGGGRKLSFRGDAFNVLNRAGRGDPVTDINNANFGHILSTQASTRQNFTPRTLQVQGSITF